MNYQTQQEVQVDTVQLDINALMRITECSNKEASAALQEYGEFGKALDYLSIPYWRRRNNGHISI